MDTDFGERLKQLREMRGWNLSELARRSDISHSMILLMESGKRPNPSLDTVRKLAKGLEVSIGMLAGEEVKAANAA